MNGRRRGIPVSTANNATVAMEHIWNRSIFLLTLAMGTLVVSRSFLSLLSSHKLIYVPSPRFMMKPSCRTVAFRAVPSPKLVNATESSSLHLVGQNILHDALSNADPPGTENEMEAILPDPLVGVIHPENDVIVTFLSTMGTSLQSIVQLLGSLMAPRYASYDHDILLILLHNKQEVDEIDPEILEFLFYHWKVFNANMVVYTFPLECWDGQDVEIQMTLKGDPFKGEKMVTYPPTIEAFCHLPQSLVTQRIRYDKYNTPPRKLDVLFLEISRILIGKYNEGSRSLIIEPSYVIPKIEISFQSNPFDDMPYHGGELHLFEKSDSISIGTDDSLSYRLKAAYGQGVITETLASQPVITSAVIMGHNSAMKKILGLMIFQYTNTSPTHCSGVSCNIAYLNALYYSGVIHKRIPNVIVSPRGDGAANDLSGYFQNGTARSIFKYHRAKGRKVVVQNDGVTPSPIVFPIQDFNELLEIVSKQSADYLNEWNEYLASNYGNNCKDIAEGSLRWRVMNCQSRMETSDR